MEVEFKNNRLWAKRQLIWKNLVPCGIHVILFLISTFVFLLLFFTFSQSGKLWSFSFRELYRTSDDENRDIFNTGYYRMAIHVLHELAEKDGGSNVVISPLSLMFSMSMLLDCSWDEPTFSNLKNVTGWHLLSRNDIEENVRNILNSINDINDGFEVNNSLFINRGEQLDRECLKRLVRVYKAETAITNFEDKNSTKRRLDKWLTDDFPFDQVYSDVAILASRVVLDCRWKFPFSPLDTAESVFVSANATKNRVMMMHQTNKFGFGVLDGLNILRLPYDGNHMNMYVVMPKEETTLKQARLCLLEDTKKYMVNIDKYLETLNVDVCLPKMKMEWSGSLRPLLSDDAGTGSIFSPLESWRTPISDLLLQAKLKVEEAGTEGSSVTFTRMTDRQSSEEFCATRPFLVYIMDSVHKTLLFLGQYTGK